jgi:acylphosphatase
MKVRRHLFVEGRVQGVFYRASAQREGVRLGLSGWVKNLPDGRVEILVEGEEKAVEEFLSWCRKGPPLAKVTRIVVEEDRSDQPLPYPFTIRYGE